MSDKRTLTSSKLRNALFIAARGRCQICDSPLTSGWHADHIVPFVQSEETNVHKMQALCASCNIKKGASPMITPAREVVNGYKMRRHQRQAQYRAHEIAKGNILDRKTTVEVTPGGGKSLLVSIFYHELNNAGHVDGIIWVVPRKSLSVQAANSFTHPYFNPLNSIRQSANTEPPFIRKPGCGYVTTYQSIDAQPDIHIQALAGLEYLCVLDEPHHMYESVEASRWAKSIQPIVEGAKHVLIMSGTIERNDRERVPFIDYEPKGKSLVPTTHVTYTYGDAFSEKAVLGMAFQYCDGIVKWIKDGEEFSGEISDEDIDPKILISALTNPGYRDRFLEESFRNWLAFRAQVYHGRMLIVCHEQKAAIAVKEWVRKKHPAYKVVLAISDEEGSQSAIARFRDNKDGDILVTVAMAYEGLDIPDLTHLVCLTNVRSVPWLTQMFARVTRFDSKATDTFGNPLEWERQYSTIFVPDDVRMMKVVDGFLEQEKLGLKMLREPRRSDGGEGDGYEGDAPDIDPEVFALLEARLSNVSHGTETRRMDDNENDLVNRIRKKYPAMIAVPPLVILSLYADMKSDSIGTFVESQPVQIVDELKLRNECQTLANAIDRARGLKNGATNRTEMLFWGKSRNAMSLSELNDAKKRLVSLTRANNMEDVSDA